MLMIYRDEKEWEARSQGERNTVFQAAVAYSEARRANGFYQGGEPLEPTHTATTVRVKQGKPVMTDGPFAETKEQLGGYYLLDVADLDEAIKWAHKCPAAPVGTIELRPIQEFPDAS